MEEENDYNDFQNITGFRIRNNVNRNLSNTRPQFISTRIEVDDFVPDDDQADVNNHSVQATNNRIVRRNGNIEEDEEEAAAAEEEENQSQSRFIQEIDNSLRINSSIRDEIRTGPSNRARGASFRGRGSRARGRGRSNSISQSNRTNSSFSTIDTVPVNNRLNAHAEAEDDIQQMGTGKNKDVISYTLHGLSQVSPHNETDPDGCYSSCSDQEKFEDFLQKEGIGSKKKSITYTDAFEKQSENNKHKDVYQSTVESIDYVLEQRRKDIDQEPDEEYNLETTNQRSVSLNTIQEMNAYTPTGECFLCFHSSTSKVGETDIIKDMNQLIEDLFGRKSLYAIAKTLHRVHLYRVYIPARHSNKEVSLWRTKDAYYHLTKCLELQPTNYVVSTLEKLQRSQNYIFDNCLIRNEVLVSGNSRMSVDIDALKSLKLIHDMTMKLYEKDPHKMALNTSGIRFDNSKKRKI